MTTPRPPRSQSTLATELTVLAQRVSANEELVNNLAQQVQKIADQMATLSATTQVLGSVGSTATNHIADIEDQVRSLVTQLNAHTTDLAVIKDSISNLQRTNDRTSEHSFSLTQNVVVWIMAAAAALISLLSFIANHWK